MRASGRARAGRPMPGNERARARGGRGSRGRGTPRSTPRLPFVSAAVAAASQRPRPARCGARDRAAGGRGGCDPAPRTPLAPAPAAPPPPAAGAASGGAIVPAAGREHWRGLGGAAALRSSHLGPAGAEQAQKT